MPPDASKPDAFSASAVCAPVASCGTCPLSPSPLKAHTPPAGAESGKRPDAGQSATPFQSALSSAVRQPCAQKTPATSVLAGHAFLAEDLRVLHQIMASQLECNHPCWNISVAHPLGTVDAALQFRGDFLTGVRLTAHTAEMYQVFEKQQEQIRAALAPVMPRGGGVAYDFECEM